MNETSYSGLHADLTGQIISAAIEVHTELGCGLKEEAYEAALAWELTQRGHKALRQVPCPVIYKGVVFCRDDEHPKRIDLIVDDTIVVEVKAVCTRHPVFAAQCRTYLRMLNLSSGLVLNFGFPSLKEGIEHVTNPKAPAQPLPNTKTPGGESNLGRGTAFAQGSLGVPKSGAPDSQTPRLPAAAATADVCFRSGEFRSPGVRRPRLQNSKTPNSGSNGFVSTERKKHE